MRVVLADVEAPALDAACEGLRGRGFDVLGVPTDVSQADSVEQLAQRTLAHYGGGASSTAYARLSRSCSRRTPKDTSSIQRQSPDWFLAHVHKV
jgi:NAD(P)-dependent dehydrogenase (short-subunit alcohol dehydrogenase family)